MNKLKQHLTNDKADSIVSLIFVIPIIVALLITIIDVSTFYNNKAQIDAIARDGARTVAIVGGTGTTIQGTPLENRYGLGTDTCSDASKAGAKGISADSTPVECNIALALHNNTRLTSVEINEVKCTPIKTESVGANTTCTILWGWNSIPGSALSIIQLGKDRKSIGTAEAEVNLTGISLRDRGVKK